MLLNGINHVAILTSDTERFVRFYVEVFGAEVTGGQDMEGHGRLTFVRIGEHSDINLFEGLRQQRGAAADANVRPWADRPHGAAGRFAGQFRRDPSAFDQPGRGR